MAIVPLLVIRTKVMIAISRSGTSTPNACKPKTSLGFGHGTAVEMRTFMYDTRKQLKMNVSLTRKIHIIALPHGTWNVCLSADQSVTMLFQRSAGPSCATALIPSCGIGFYPLALRRPGKKAGAGASSRHQQPEQPDPDDQKEVPIRRAKLHARPELFDGDD